MITLVPGHNVLSEPYYWYETTTLVPIIGWIPMFVTALILQLEFWSNITYAKNISTMIYLYVLGAFTCSIASFSYNYLWTNILGFYPPAPFTGYFCGTQMIFTLHAATWFRYGRSYQRMELLYKHASLLDCPNVLCHINMIRQDTCVL